MPWNHFVDEAHDALGIILLFQLPGCQNDRLASLRTVLKSLRVASLMDGWALRALLLTTLSPFDVHLGHLNAIFENMPA